MDNYFDRWSEIIKNTELPKREPMWQKAIDILISEDAMEPTISSELTQEQLQEIVYYDKDVSAYEILTDIARWINAGDTLYLYLGRYFFNCNDVWLAYAMATRIALFWNGEDWVTLDKL